VAEVIMADELVAKIEEALPGILPGILPKLVENNKAVRDSYVGTLQEVKIHPSQDFAEELVTMIKD
jgi:hypothetical protein